MGKLFKWLFGLILLVLVLLVAAIVILPMVIDPNDYKPQIVATAKDRLGRDFAIERDLNLSVFPWLGIETGGVRVGNAAGFSAPTFAEIEQLGLKAKLLPLLSGRVEVDTVVVKGLRLNLEKNASGETNWDDLAARGEQQRKTDEGTTAGADSGAAPFSLSVQGVQIEDARVSWDDRQSGEKYVLDGARLVTGALTPGATVPVEAGVRFTSSKPAMTLDVDLDTSLSSDAALTRFEADGLTLNLDAAGEGLPADGARLTLKTGLAVDTAAGTLALSGLEISGPAMAASGDVTVREMQTRPAAEGSLRIAETNLKTLASMFASPIETSDPAALTRVSGDVAFSFVDGALKLDPLKIQLDDSNLTGHLHVLNTTGPVVRTKMQLDQIDLDRYMPPAPSGQSAPAEGAPAGGQATAAAEDPFAALRTLDFVGEFGIGQLKAGNARMSNVNAKVVSRNGVLKVDPMAAKLYQGSFDGSVALDASGKKPRLNAKPRLTDIQVGELLKDVAGEERLIGRGEFQADVSMIGISEQEVRRSLSGSSRFAFRDGALKGVNIAQVIREASDRLGLARASESTGTPGQTDFTELTGSLNMNNGVISNQDLQAKSPLLRIEGKGDVNLPANTIDYLVVTELVGSLEGQGGKGRDELSGVPIPVRVSGSLNDPSYRPDLEAALSAKAKAKIEEKKEEVRQKVEDKVKQKLDETLKGLFR